MTHLLSAASLAKHLSQLKAFSRPKAKEEQYITDSAIAAEVLHHAAMLGDIQDRKVSDLGAGTGILGLGCALLRAKKVSLVERDGDAVEDCKENVERVQSWLGIEDETGIEIIPENIEDFNRKSETLVMNPPFGTKKKHADRAFLLKAFELAPVAYSFHKTSTLGFIEALCADHDYKITHTWRFPHFPLKKTYDFQRKPVGYADIVALRLEKVRIEPSEDQGQSI